MELAIAFRGSCLRHQRLKLSCGRKSLSAPHFSSPEPEHRLLRKMNHNEPLVVALLFSTEDSRQ